jgi:uncharacterized Ntn-hydrolase superfamily protein/phosphohistidine phosphatase SixA
MHTYSIVARDPETGEMGVAVQSHWFSVGSLCPWAEAGVGAIATQSFVNVSFGPRGLDMLRGGQRAHEVLDTLIAADEGRDVRQVAIVDAQGNIAAHTGAQCIAAAGHTTGDSWSAQANMMLNHGVWPAMAAAFEASSGPLAERLVAALEGAQAAGGDIRGKQSAALLVVRAESTGQPWEDRIVDLRVDDHPDPVVEIARLLRAHRAYEHMNEGDVALEQGDIEGALNAYRSAEAMFPENLEMRYWHAISLANVGRVDEALPMFASIFGQDPNWRTLTERLPAVGVLDVSEDELAKIARAKMKTVLLMRHGKSKRGPKYETDFERPLAKRGRRDAARMGEFLVEQGLLPDVIISSPAERARRTAERCADAADYQGEIRYEDPFYFGGEDAYLERLWAMDDTLSCVLFVGHNPTTEAVVETLSHRYVRMPTAALARIDFAADRWTDLFQVGGRLAWVQIPREF